MDGHILAFIELPPGFDIFVDKIKFQNFHVRIKCYMCQDNRQAAKGSVYLFALLAELLIHIHVVPLNRSIRKVFRHLKSHLLILTFSDPGRTPIMRFPMSPQIVHPRGLEDAKSHWLHLFDFSPLCVFKGVLKLSAQEDA